MSDAIHPGTTPQTPCADAAFESDLHPAGRERDRRRIAVELLPAGTGGARAARTGRAPDRAVLVQLEELIARGHDCSRGGIVVQHLPARTGRAAATGTGRSPDRTVLVKLKELIARGRDPDRGRVAVQLLPPWPAQAPAITESGGGGSRPFQRQQAGPPWRQGRGALSAAVAGLTGRAHRPAWARCATPAGLE